MATRVIRTPGLPAPAVSPVPPTPQPANDGLPNAVDVDPKAIDQPVLTKQGWVVPDEEHRKQLRKLAEAKKALGIEG